MGVMLSATNDRVIEVRLSGSSAVSGGKHTGT